MTKLVASAAARAAAAKLGLGAAPGGAGQLRRSAAPALDHADVVRLKPPPLEKLSCPPFSGEERARQVEALLRERFPLAFRVPRPPLAIGIHKQIRAVTDIACKPLDRFLRLWVRRADYLAAVAHGEVRVNLDGSPAEPPTAGHRRAAASLSGKVRKRVPCQSVK